jgi:hypothetical protein
MFEDLKAEVVNNSFDAVQAGLFLHYPATDTERSLALHLKRDVYEYESSLDDRLREAYGALCGQATKKGWLYNPATVSSSGAAAEPGVKLTSPATGEDSCSCRSGRQLQLSHCSSIGLSALQQAA